MNVGSVYRMDVEDFWLFWWGDFAASEFDKRNTRWPRCRELTRSDAHTCLLLKVASGRQGRLCGLILLGGEVGWIHDVDVRELLGELTEIT